MGLEPAVDPDMVELVVIAVPDTPSLQQVAQGLRALVLTDQIRVLDLVVVSTAVDGGHTTIELEGAGDLAVLLDVDGEVGGFLSDDDIAIASSALPPASTALLLVVEDRWARVLSDAARAAGGRIVGGERIPRYRVEDSMAALLRAASTDGTGGLS